MSSLDRVLDTSLKTAFGLARTWRSTWPLPWESWAFFPPSCMQARSAGQRASAIVAVRYGVSPYLGRRLYWWLHWLVRHPADPPIAASPLAAHFLTWGCVAVGLFLYRNLLHSAFGRAVNTARHDALRAVADGVNVSGRPRRVPCGFRRCCRPWWLALRAREQLSGSRISQQGYRLAGAVDGHRRRGTQTAVPDHRCVCATDHRDVSARR